MANYASKAIALAREELGYHEKASNSQLDSKTANSGSNNYTKYANYIDKNCPNWFNGKKNGYAWCDVFFDYLMIRSYGEAEAYKLTCQPKKSCGAGCKYSYGYYKAKNQVGKNPKLGAQIFFSDTGKESNIEHTGIVIDFDATRVWTIEGNSGNKVAEHVYNRTNSKIYGYGYPAYDAEPVAPVVTPAPAPTTTKSIETIAKEVINGQWGNGDDRKKRLAAAGYDYNTVQAKVNELLKTPTKTTTTKTMTVTAKSGLNVRSGAGTNYRILKTLPCGTKVEVDSISNGWAYSKKIGGYLSATYLK